MTDLKLSASLSTILEAVSRRSVSLRPCDSGEPRVLFSVQDRRTVKNLSVRVLCDRTSAKGAYEQLKKTCFEQRDHYPVFGEPDLYPDISWYSHTNFYKYAHH